MKTFVTGACGQIGSEVCKHLDDVVKFDKKLGHNIMDKQMLMEDMAGCGAVVHLAAHPHPNINLEFDDYIQNNVFGTYNVVSCAVELGIKEFVYASSTSYYGFEAGIDGVKTPAVETQAPFTSYVRDCEASDVVLAYSLSKIMAENFIAYYALLKKIRATIIRFGPVGLWTLKENTGLMVKIALTENTEWYRVFNGTEKETVEVCSDKIWALAETGKPVSVQTVDNS